VDLKTTDCCDEYFVSLPVLTNFYNMKKEICPEGYNKKNKEPVELKRKDPKAKTKQKVELKRNGPGR